MQKKKKKKDVRRGKNNSKLVVPFSFCVSLGYHKQLISFVSCKYRGLPTQTLALAGEKRDCSFFGRYPSTCKWRFHAWAMLAESVRSLWRESSRGCRRTDSKTRAAVVEHAELAFSGVLSFTRQRGKERRQVCVLHSSSDFRRPPTGSEYLEPVACAAASRLQTVFKGVCTRGYAVVCCCCH